MNILKQLIVTPKVRKRVRAEIQRMVDQTKVKDYDVKFIKTMEDAMVNTQIAHMDMSAYPLHERILDRLNQIIDSWIDYHKSKSAYYREQKVWSYRY